MFRLLLRLSKQSVIYGFGVVVSQIAGFFLIPVYTRYLTPGDYGTLEVFQTTLSVLAVIFIMGLSTALFRSYYLHEDETKKKTVISTAFLFLTLTSALLTLILMVLAGNFSSLFFNSGEYANCFRLIFLTLFCDTGIVIGLSVFRAREEPARYAVISACRVLLSFALAILFVVGLRKGVLGILAGNFITSAVLYVFLVAGVLGRSGLTFSFYELKKMLAFGLPLVPVGIGSCILTFSDRYFLQFLSTPTELGLYSLGYKFGLVISALLVGPFQFAWLPFIFAIAKEENAKHVYSRVFTYFVLIAIFAAVALSVLSEEVLAVMATPIFHNAYKVIPLIAMSYVLYGCYFVLMVGINLKAKTKYLGEFVIGAAVLNLGLNYLLVPAYGMMGAAIATLISYIILPIGSYWFSRRYYPIPYEWGRIFKIILAAAMIYAGSRFIRPDQSGAVTGAFKSLALLTYPILLYVFRFYQPEEKKKVWEIIKSARGYAARKVGR